ncbi:hypothetical protein J6590_103790 [Homalodisca vitripennis]|nr:hypothetical protein J6590_103790 [Homalodisca vitripennis]
MGQSDLSYGLPFGRYRARNITLSEKISGMSNVRAFYRLTMEDIAKTPTVHPLSGLQEMPAGVKNARFLRNFFEGFKSKKVRFSDFSSQSYCERNLRAKFQLPAPPALPGQWIAVSKAKCPSVRHRTPRLDAVNSGGQYDLPRQPTIQERVEHNELNNLNAAVSLVNLAVDFNSLNLKTNTSISNVVNFSLRKMDPEFCLDIMLKTEDVLHGFTHAQYDRKRIVHNTVASPVEHGRRGCPGAETFW